MTTTDKKALTQWTKSAISYKNYQDFIQNKPEKFKLSLIDLLFISNFKGGNATINEPSEIIAHKLVSYSKKLVAIHDLFRDKSLKNLSDYEINLLNELIGSICDLTLKSKETKIDGFSVSYLSAMLNAYFPVLIPILDRRVLINLKLVSNSDIDSYGQIKHIRRFYSPLVKEVANLSRVEDKEVREIDKILFTTRLIQV